MLREFLFRSQTMKCFKVQEQENFKISPSDSQEA